MRGWAKSKGWIQQPNPYGQPERWGVNQNNQFEWRLRIKPEPSLRQNLDIGSNVPRFDSRLEKGVYINPFTNTVGDKTIGTHIELEAP